MLFRDEKRACEHGRRIVESYNGLTQVWCLECPHTWIEMPLNVRDVTKAPKRTATPTGPMTVFHEET